MIVQIYSYSIKYRQELPVKSPNFIFDCRSVKNPGRIENLKKMTGLDQEVILFLDAEKSAMDFMKGLDSILIETLPIFKSKQYTPEMSILFCCTGGRHRSVYFCEYVGRKLQSMDEVEVKISHLDIDNHYF